MPTRLIHSVAVLATAVAAAGFALGAVRVAADDGIVLDDGFRLYFTWHEPVSGAELPLYASPYGSCHDGGCAAKAGPVTLTDPLTVTIGTTATVLAFRHASGLPERLHIAAYRAERLRTEPVDGSHVLWRLPPDALPIEVTATWREFHGWAATLPADEGLWLLDIAGDWPSETGVSARWAVLLKAIDGTGEQDFAGVFKAGNEWEGFYPSLNGCSSDVPTWHLIDTPDGRFHEAFTAFCDQWAGMPGWTDPYREWPATEFRFRGIIGPRDPTSTAFTSFGGGHHVRNVVITSRLDIRPTLSCGMDAGDLLLADARVEAVECVGGVPIEHLFVAVRNVGSQPVGPFTVAVTGAAPSAGDGATIVQWPSAGLDVGGRATFTFARDRFPGSPDAGEARAWPAAERSERFNARNNRRAVDPLVGATACAPPRPSEAARRLWLPVLAIQRRWR